jgi:hypothetical protein
MTQLKTSQGHIIDHCHVPNPPCQKIDFTLAEIEKARDWMAKHFPDTIEVRQASRRYNCHGHAYARSHGWVNEPRPFLTDDYFEVSFDSANVGDVVIYVNGDTLMHSAVVRRIFNGEIMEMRSKWGEGPEVLHELKGIPHEYGVPVQIFRRQQNNAPFKDTTNEGEMSNEESKHDVIERAISDFSDPDIYLRLMLASSPEAAQKIIELFPGVSKLIDIGSEAGKAVLEFFRQEKAQADERLLSVALYLLDRIPTVEAAQPLAQMISSGTFSGINNQLAARAFLTAAGIQSGDDDPIEVAKREAENFK